MPTEPQAFEFGSCRLDLRTGQLLRDGQAVHLAPRCFEILRYLAERPARLVSKEELLDAVWPDTNVELAALTVAIGRIRQALDDDPRAPQFIETVHRRGYRFIAGVSVDTRLGGPPENGASTRKEMGHARQPEPGRLRRWAMGLSPAALLILAVLLFTNLRSANRISEPGRLFSGRLTTTGNIIKAAISSDGARVAYVNLEAGREGLRIRTIDGFDDVELLAPSERRVFGCTFTPQGNALLCSLQQGHSPAAALYRIPLQGQREPQELGVRLDSAVSFSSDGARIVFMRDNAAAERSELWTASPDGTRETLLASRSAPEYFDYPVWSPDDRTIAATLVNRERERVGVALVDAATGKARTIANDAWLFARNVYWSSTGTSLLLTGRLPEESNFQIWSVPLAAGSLRALTGTDSTLPRFAVANRTGTIVGVESRSTSRVLLADTLQSGEQRPNDRWTTLPQGELPAAGSSYVGWTSDGRLIAEAGGRLYLAAEAGHAEAITSGGSSGLPSNCGPYIVYTNSLAGHFEIRAYNLAEGASRTLVRAAGFAGPHCAPESDFLIYSAVQPDGWNGLFRMPLDGGPATQLAGGDYVLPSVSNDGRRIAAFWSDPSEVRQSRLDALAILAIDGRPFAKFPLPPTADRTTGPRWTPDGQSVAYIDLRDGAANLWAQPLAGGPARRLTRLQTARIFSFAWSHDGRRLAVAVGEQPSDLVGLTPGESSYGAWLGF
jgi:DNA-binding winged helix-turn-helix (wHTH) protein/Tol biopolymer transport system component